MRALQDVKQSGLKTTLLVDPVDDFAIGGVAGDGFAQELADAGVIILIDSEQQLSQANFEYIPRQIVFIGAHDHRMLDGCHVDTDQQLFIEFFLGRKASDSADQNTIILISTLAEALAPSHMSKYQNLSHYIERFERHRVSKTLLYQRVNTALTSILLNRRKRTQTDC